MGWEHDSGWGYDEGWDYGEGWDYDEGWSYDEGLRAAALRLEPNEAQARRAEAED